MQTNTLATILGQAMADSDDFTLPGIESAVGEIACHIRSVSGDDIADRFMSTVRSSSLRIMSSGVSATTPTVASALARIDSALSGSTSPSL